ncbi:MAG: hypothetical protein ACRDPK_20270 [Carbonactinosporaceae bacterium]
MNIAFVAALALQMLSLLILRHRLGKAWFGYPFTYFVLVAIAYHGIGEIMLHLSTSQMYTLTRLSVEHRYIDLAALIVSAALLTCVIGYVLRVKPVFGSANGRKIGLKLPDWRALALICLPLVIATVEDRGYHNGSPLIFGQDPLITIIAKQFLLLGIVLTTFSFVMRHGRRWLIPAVAGQSLILATTGQRLEIVAGGVMIVFLLHRTGMTPSMRSIMSAACIISILFLSLVSIRENQGREIFRANNGFEARAGAVLAGINSSPGDIANLIGQTGIRLDCNSFAGVMQRGLEEGNPPLGTPEMLRLFSIAVPSVMYPGKHESQISSAKVNLLPERFRFPAEDYLPGSIGLYLGFLGPWGLCLFMAILGMLLAMGENWLLRSLTTPRFLILASGLEGVIFFEQGLTRLLTSLRAGLALAVLAFVVQQLRVRRSALGNVPQRRGDAIRLRGVHFSWQPRNVSRLGALSSVRQRSPL